MKPTLPLIAALVCVVVPALAVPVAVTVVGPDGQPLPGAKLDWFEVKFVAEDADKTTEQAGANGVFRWNWDGDFADKRPIGEKRFLRARVSAPGMASRVQIIEAGQTTIALQSTRSWGGIVRDEQGKPIAGATLKLGQVKPPDVTEDDYSTLVEVAPQTVVTDAQGRWSFSGLPARGTALVTLVAPGFARQSRRLAIGEGEAAPLTVKPGGAIKGQLLRPNGSPIVGEKIAIGNGAPNETVTDAQGRFVLEGIEPGEITVFLGDYFGQRKAETLPEYILERLRFVEVEAEKTADMGAIKAQKGLLLQARVVGADTKAPIPDARFRMGYNQIANVVDAGGTLRARVAASQIEDGFERPKIESKGYVDYELPLATFKTEGDVADLGTVEMKRGNAIRGTIRLEGVPDGTKAPSISFSRENKYDFISPKDDGSFASKTLEAGSYSVNMNGGQENWQIVSPRTVTLPDAGETFAPIEVVIKRLTPVLPIIESARGRIVDENGQGVAGVTVSALMALENGNTYPNQTALTDATGAFAIAAPARGDIIRVEFTGAEHPNYIVGGPPTIAVKEGIATISGLIAKKRGAVYAGRVVDAQGQPAKNAWVAVVEARNYEPVQTDADGQFALPDVPLTQFTLIAAQGRDWAKQAAQSDAPNATLKLQSNAVVDRERALERIVAIKDGVSSNELFAAWDVLGAEGVERFLRRNGEPSAEVMALFGAELARRDPAQLLRRAPELLGQSDGEARENLEAQLNLARAASDDAGARVDANAWLDEQEQVKRAIDARSVTQLLQMAAVAQKLKRPDSAQWLDYAAAVAAQLKGNDETNAYQWSRALAALGADGIARFAEGRSIPAEFQLWGSTTPILARAGDVTGARQGLARMETLMNDAAMTQAAEEARKTRRYAPSRQLGEVQSAVAGALAASDPVAALALAQKIDDVFARVSAMNGVGQGAQKAGNADVAETALRDVMKARIGNVELFAQAASIGARVSPQLGAELFALAKDKASPADRSGFGPPSLGAWAFYHAPYDAAQSRVLIEREWHWRLPAATQNKTDPGSGDFRALYELVRGMTAVDAARASEMQAQVDALQTRSYGRTMTQFDIAIAALATEQQREQMGANEQF